jgi:hypothetical protein
MTHAPDLNTPFRLADAVKQAFPHGGMTMSGLRREAARGRLVLERIAGKDFVTLAAIGAMRELCRVKPEWPVASKQKGTAELLPQHYTPGSSNGRSKTKWLETSNGPLRRPSTQRSDWLSSARHDAWPDLHPCRSCRALTVNCKRACPCCRPQRPLPPDWARPALQRS